MALSIEDMSRLTSYVGANASLEKCLSDSEIPEEDVAEATRYWAEMVDAYANLKPGEQMSVPGEWS